MDGKLIVSSTSTLALNGWAGFGDVGDIFNDEVIPSEGGTIIYKIDVRRQFLPGNYRLHVVEVNPKSKAQAAIICREDVDPLKIHQLLSESNTGADFACSNVISRYDWMHSRNWGSEEEDFEKEDKFKEYLMKVFTKDFGVKPYAQGGRLFFELVFFVNAEKVKEISNAEFAVEKQNEYFYTMVSAENTIIGFIIHVPKGNKFILGDWNYACLLQDKKTGKYFSFIFQDQYACQWDVKDFHGLKEIGGKINYTFDIDDFLFKQ